MVRYSVWHGSEYYDMTRCDVVRHGNIWYGMALHQLIRTSDSELRGLTRERLGVVVKAFREVLKRGHRKTEAFRQVERLQLNLALKLYRYTTINVLTVSIHRGNGWGMVVCIKDNGDGGGYVMAMMGDCDDCKTIVGMLILTLVRRLVLLFQSKLATVKNNIRSKK